MSKAITLRTVLEHIQAMRTALEGQINTVEQRLSKKITALDERLSTQLAAVDGRLSMQIENIEHRLDTIEVAIVSQRHEQRITRLEKVVLRGKSRV